MTRQEKQNRVNFGWSKERALRVAWLGLFLIAGPWALNACDTAPKEPESKKMVTPPQETRSEPQMVVAEVPVSPDDPLQGKFTLDQATEGLSKGASLMATIKTELGDLSCELFEDKAPRTVANFVGLARGLRPFKHDGEWVKRPGYDNTTFHRLIRGFMIQGGDPQGNGTGEPGYVVPDEIWPGAKHDRRGLLCMANRGPNTNGMQFFITDAAAPHLDRSYTIFGTCGPHDLIEKIASQPVQGDRAVNPPKIKTITISREN